MSDLCGGEECSCCINDECRDTSDCNEAAIIGGSVIGGVLLLLCCVVACCGWHCHKRRARRRAEWANREAQATQAGPGAQQVVAPVGVGLVSGGPSYSTGYPGQMAQPVYPVGPNSFPYPGPQQQQQQQQQQEQQQQQQQQQFASSQYPTGNYSQHPSGAGQLQGQWNGGPQPGFQPSGPGQGAGNGWAPPAGAPVFTGGVPSSSQGLQTGGVPPSASGAPFNAQSFLGGSSRPSSPKVVPATTEAVVAVPTFHQLLERIRSASDPTRLLTAFEELDSMRKSHPEIFPVDAKPQVIQASNHVRESSPGIWSGGVPGAYGALLRDLSDGENAGAGPS